MNKFSATFWRAVAILSASIYANRREPGLWLIGLIVMELIILLFLFKASSSA